jgi:glycosyltransferase involved in cell wall biosynthesis
MPLVSFAIPVYNAARFLQRAMDSALAQSFQDFEIVAVDDGSRDRSPGILASYAKRDSRVRNVRQENTGIVGALNAAVTHSRGDFIARMDADDFSMPDRIERQVAYLNANPQCVAVGTDVIYTDPEGAPLVRHFPAQDHGSIVAQLLEGNGGAMIHPTVMFRRGAFEAVGGYRFRYQWIEDLDLYLRLSEIGQLANLPGIHLEYRQHLKSVNYTRGDRNNLRMELVNPRRLAIGLSPLQNETSATRGYATADWRRHWAYDAARGGNWASARKNATRALLEAPFDRRNWKCLRYVIDSSSVKLPASVKSFPVAP